VAKPTYEELRLELRNLESSAFYLTRSADEMSAIGMEFTDEQRARLLHETRLALFDAKEVLKRAYGD